MLAASGNGRWSQRRAADVRTSTTASSLGASFGEFISRGSADGCQLVPPGGVGRGEPLLAHRPCGALADPGLAEADRVPAEARGDGVEGRREGVVAGRVCPEAGVAL